MNVKPKRLGELVLRSENPKALVHFYRDIIGLEPYAEFGTATFLKIADAQEGHPQLLAIFDSEHRYSGPDNMQADRADAESGTLHHFAFVLEADDFITERYRIRDFGVDLEYGDHSAFGWRSVYMHDPDGNSVELVCYDASIFDPVKNRTVQPST